MEANLEKRNKYLDEIKDIAWDKLVYIDESGIEMNIVQDKGWGLVGQVLPAQKSGKYFERTNIVAGLVTNKPIAPFVFNGTCNTRAIQLLGRAVFDKGAYTGPSSSYG